MIDPINKLGNLQLIILMFGFICYNITVSYKSYLHDILKNIDSKKKNSAEITFDYHADYGFILIK